jgi:hypothetical protein
MIQSVMSVAWLRLLQFYDVLLMDFPQDVNHFEMDGFSNFLPFNTGHLSAVKTTSRREDM